MFLNAHKRLLKSTCICLALGALAFAPAPATAGLDRPYEDDFDAAFYPVNPPPQRDETMQAFNGADISMIEQARGMWAHVREEEQFKGI